MNASRAKLRAAILSVATALSLAVVKCAVALASGSLAVLASAIDSMLDILMSGLNLLAIRQAAQPADKNHAYGHGKFESMASLIQALIIGGSGVWIFIESIQHLIAVQVAPTHLNEGIAVLAAGAAISLLVSFYLKKVGQETASTALAADALHFRMDVFTNLALLSGLYAMRFFALPRLDAILSCLVAIYIFREAILLIRQALRDALDEQLPEDVLTRIEEAARLGEQEFFRIHNLRTRAIGSRKMIDFHLNVCESLTVATAHRITDRIERAIQRELGDADVTIHIEPCEERFCQAGAAWRQAIPLAPPCSSCKEH
ncbi:MAG: cation diffusion facilitator family transporter [Desulfobulbaceae bacterium]|jgi:cation diffusion facilitator family transporter|nr:cation diffusion facilitator family transporter [Desulfobulbaceae bacterium]